MALPPDPMPSFRQFDGLYNTVPPERVPPTGLVEAVNVDVSDAQQLSRRAGYSLLTAGAFHSLWSNGRDAYVVRGTDLCAVDPSSFTCTPIAPVTGRVAYVDLGDRTLASDGSASLVLRGLRSARAGLPQAGLPLALPAPRGDLLAGTYKFACTFLRGDGLEGGTAEAGTVEVPADGRINFLSIPTSPSAVSVCVYVSAPNGTTLYRVATLPAGTPTWTLTNAPAGVELQTQFMSAMPPFSSGAWLNGRAFAAVDSLLVYSEAYNPEMYRAAFNYMVFETAITVLGATRTGIYVSDQECVWWLSGDNLPLARTRVLNYPAIPGTWADIDGGRLGVAGDSAIFATREGIVLAQDGGIVKNVTQDKYLYGPATYGASLYQKKRGYGQYILTLQSDTTGVAHGIPILYRPY